MKSALITGIGGQDGTYLTEFLLAKGYTVHGIHRHPTSPGHRSTDNAAAAAEPQLVLHHGDMADANSLIRAIQESQPREIYNLAAQSRVAASFESPECTADINALGTLRLLEAIRLLGLSKTVRFYQASSSELYGLAGETAHSESTPFHPRSPYSVAKLYAYWITVNYREAYGMYACNGILFNHESPIRGESFVTRKITRGLARIKMGLEERLLLGNMDAKRDWGHARDYAEMMWMMLQQQSPEDFVIATGEQHSVREFVSLAAEEMGIDLTWRGRGLEERAYDRQGRYIIGIDPHYFRPSEVDSVVGDASKARRKLGWKPKMRFRDIVAELALADLRAAEHERVLVNSSGSDE
jgi:GDPmannose 4,6-dehydratase